MRYNKLINNIILQKINETQETDYDLGRQLRWMWLTDEPQFQSYTLVQLDTNQPLATILTKEDFREIQDWIK